VTRAYRWIHGYLRNIEHPLDRVVQGYDDKAEFTPSRHTTMSCYTAIAITDGSTSKRLTRLIDPVPISRGTKIKPELIKGNESHVCMCVRGEPYIQRAKRVWPSRSVTSDTMRTWQLRGPIESLEISWMLPKPTGDWREMSPVRWVRTTCFPPGSISQNSNGVDA